MANAAFHPLAFFVKGVLMVVLLCVDAFWNSSNEYDDYGTNVQLAFGGQLFIQVFVFIVLFLILCDTYPFQIGLLSELLADFKPVLGIHPLYILSTMALGIWRMTIIADGVTSVMVLWRRRSYAAVSVAHKVFAIAYYLLNMRATLRLGRPLYYQKDYWVSRHTGKKHTHAS